MVAADDVGGAVQADVQQRGRRQAGGVALRAQRSPTRRRRRRPRAAGRRWWGRSATPARCARSPAPPGTSPSRERCACGRMSTSTAPRRSASGTSAAGSRRYRRRARSPGRRRCGSSRSLRLVGQFGALAAQRVAVGDLVVRHRGQRRRVGVHAQRRRDRRLAPRRAPTGP